MSNFQNFQQLTTPAVDLDGASEKNGLGSIPMSSDKTMRIAPGNQGGTISVVTRDGQPTVEVRGVERVEPAKQNSGIEGLLGTGRQLTGAAVHGISDVIDSTVFTVNGIQMSAKSAANIGLLIQDAPNCYSIPTAGEAPVVEAAPTEEPFSDHLSKPVLEALSELDKNLGSSKATDSAIAGSIAHLANGNLEGAVKDFTSRTGVDPEMARGYVEGIMHDSRESIKARLQSAFGVPNGEECLQHLEATLSPSAKASLALELFSGSNAAFKRVADGWISHMRNTVTGAELYAKVK